MINRTYTKDKRIDPRIFFLIAMILLFAFFSWQNCSGQTNIYLSTTTNACEDYNSAYIFANMPNNVHSISWEFYFNPLEQEFSGISFADIMLLPNPAGISLYYNVLANSIRISWVSVFTPLPITKDTLVGICFHKLGNYSLLEWNHSNPNYLDITDKDGITIDSVYYFDGSIECVTSSIRELQIKENKPTKYFKDGKVYIERNGIIYNLNGQQ